MKQHLTIKSPAEIKGIVARLNTNQRELLHLVLLFLNNNQIAEILKTTEKAVRYQMTGLYAAFGIGPERDRSNKRNELLRQCYGLNHRPCANPFPSGFVNEQGVDGRRKNLYQPTRVTLTVENSECPISQTTRKAEKPLPKLTAGKQSLPVGL